MGTQTVIDAAAVLTWLAEHPVPAGPSPELTRFRRAAARLGAAAIPALKYALRFAPVDIQYGAQVALRALGIEVWADGYGSSLEYVVTERDGSVERIRPLMGDEDIPAVATIVREPIPAYGTDPYRRIEEAGRAIEAQRQRMHELARIRAEAVRELLDSGTPRAEIAKRLGVHPNYVNKLARDAGT